MEINAVKKQFPIFENEPELSYLDNAASTQTPESVIEAMSDYYRLHRANVHRGLYPLSERATELYENAREKVARFINARNDEIVFTSGTTASLNMLAHNLCKNVKAGDNIVITQMEHHANMVPWQMAQKRHGFELRYIAIERDTAELNLEKAKELIDENTKIVSLAAVSNVTGGILPMETVIEQAQRIEAITIVDAAQAVAHMPIDVNKLKADFIAFSAHKMYGPTGIGVLYGKKDILEKLDPLIFGGEMVREVAFQGTTFRELPYRLEAGTPSIASAIGFGAATDFIQSIGLNNIQTHERRISERLLRELKKIPGVKIIGDLENRIGVISFVIENIHPHDVADIAGKYGVALRAGHHCAMPLMSVLEISGTARASIGVYNDEDDIDACIYAITQAQNIFSR